MNNRFTLKKKGSGLVKDILLPILLFVVIGGLFMYGLQQLNTTSERERLRSVEQAILKATVQCYAVEGQYPQNLAYLQENYGLVLDTEKYIIQYDIFASNIMPTVLVLPMDFEQDSSEVMIDEAY